MNKFLQDFISEDSRDYKFKIGHILASSLSGFICGAVVANIIWMIALKIFNIW